MSRATNGFRLSNLPAISFRHFSTCMLWRAPEVREPFCAACFGSQSFSIFVDSRETQNHSEMRGVYMLGHCKCTQMFPDLAAADAVQVDFALSWLSDYLTFIFTTPCSH